MKKALMFVLFLGLLLMILTKKPKSLVSRINKAFRMLTVSEYVDDYTPSKYSANLYKDDLDVSSLSVKIQLVKDCISSVLDLLKFDETTIAKIATQKVSSLMDAMDVLVAIAKGVKQPSSLGDLKTVFPDVSDADTWGAKLKVEQSVNDAVDFIKDTISPESVVNAQKRKATHMDEINESLSEEELNENDLREDENDEENDDENDNESKRKNEKENDQDFKNEEEEERTPPNRVQRKDLENDNALGGFHELRYVPERKVQKEQEAEKITESDLEDFVEDTDIEKAKPFERKSPVKKQRAFRLIPTQDSPMFLTDKQISEIEKRKKRNKENSENSEKSEKEDSGKGKRVKSSSYGYEQSLHVPGEPVRSMPKYRFGSNMKVYPTNIIFHNKPKDEEPKKKTNEPKQPLPFERGNEDGPLNAAFRKRSIPITEEEEEVKPLRRVDNEKEEDEEEAKRVREEEKEDNEEEQRENEDEEDDDN